MMTAQMIIGIVCLALAIGAFTISYFQLQEKGFLFNNAYLWASPEDRRRMDEQKDSKRPYYRQSGFTFLLIGILFLIDAVYVMTGWLWMGIAFWAVFAITVVYAVVSSIKIERRKKAEKI